MDYQEKTKDELIIELGEIKQKYDSLKTTFEKSLAAKENEKLILEKLIDASEDFIQFRDATPDYNKISQIILDISGAKYVSFNIFDDNGLDFTTVALVGITENFKKGIALLGFNVIGTHWKHDPFRAEKTKQQNITRFGHLYELTGNVISKNAVFLVEITFGLGEVFIVKIVKEDKVLGDFTLLFKKGETLKNSKFVDLFAHQTGMLLDRIKSINAVRNSEIRHSSMISNISDVIGLIDAEGIIKYKSANIEKYFGWQPQDLIGANCWLLVHPGDLLRIQKEFISLLEKENSVSTVEYRFKCKDGSFKPIQLNATNLINDAIIKGVLLNFHDITARQQAQQELENSLSFLKATLESTADGILVVNLKGSIIRYNQKFADLWHITEDIQSQNVDQPFLNYILHQIVQPEVFQSKVNELQGKPEEVSLSILNFSDGHVFKCYSQPHSIRDQIVGRVWSFRDITSHKQAEDAIRLSEEKYRMLFNTNKDSIAIFRLNPDGTPSNFIELNDATTDIFRRTREELMSMNIKDLEVGVSEEVRKFKIENLQSEGSVDFETVVRDKEGNNVYLEVKAVLINYQNQPAVMNISRDISRRLQSENLLAQTHQNYETFFNAIDEFLFVLDEHGNIIHTNSTVLNRLGYTSEELNGISVLMVHPSERRDEAGRIVGEMLNGTADFCPVPLVTKSGVQIPVETRVKTGIWDGKPVIFGVTKDISRIQLSEEKFSKVFYLNPSPCGLSDIVTGKYIEVNEAFYTLFGFDKKEVIGKSVSELGILKNEERQNIASRLDKNGKGINIEADLRAKNGDTKHVLISAENIYLQDKIFRFTVVNDITDRKKAEKALQVSEAKYRNIFENVQDVFYQIDLAGIILEISPSVKHFSEFNRDELIGTQVSDMYYDLADRDIFLNALKKKGELSGHELRIKTKTDIIKWVSINARLILDSEGRPNHVDGVIRDITEQKHIQEALRESEEKHRNLFEGASDAIFIHNANSPLMLAVNELACERLGYTNAELMAMPTGGVDTSEQSLLMPERVAKVMLQGHLLFETVHQRKDGSLVPTEVSARLVNWDGQQVIMSICRDITERKQAEESLHLTTIQLKEAQEIGNFGSFSFDIASNQYTTSPQLNKIFGFSPEQKMDNKAWSSLLHPFDREPIEGFMADCIERGIPYDRDYRIIRDGHTRWIRGIARADKDSSGKIVRFSGVNIDITDRKWADEELRAREIRHSSMISNISDVIGIIGLDGIMKYKSPNIEKWFGWQPQDLVGTDGWLTVHPDDLERIQKGFLELLEKDNTVKTVEYRYKCKNGSYKPIELTATNLTNDPIINGVLLNYHDITERKHSEEELHESEFCLTRAEKVAKTGNWKLNINTGEFTVSQGAKIIYGMDKDSILLEHAMKMPLPEYREMLDRALTDLITKNLPYNFEFKILRSSDNNIIDIHSIAEYDKENNIVFGVIQDITEQKQAEEALRKSEERHRKILQTTLDGFWIVDLSTGTITDVNETYCRMSGYSNAEFSEIHISELDALKAPDEQGTIIGKIIANGSGIFETRHRRKDGSIFDVELSVTYQNTEGGKLFCFCRDITARKRAEEAIRESSQKWEAIISASPDGIGMVSLEGKIQLMSKKLATMYGYSIEEIPELLGKGIFGFIDPSSHKAMIDNIHKLIVGEKNQNITEYLAVKKDGSRFYIDVNSTVLLDSNGKPANILFVERDITARKQTEKTLLESRANLAAIIENTSESIWSVNTLYELVYINTEFAQTFQACYGILLKPGMNILNAVSEPSRLEWKSRYDRAFQNERFEFEEQFDFENFIMYVEIWVNPIVVDGMVIGASVFSRDITERKKAGKELKESEEKLKTIIETSPDGIAISSLEGVIQFVTSKAVFLWGFEFSDELIGRNLIEFIHPSYHEKALGLIAEMINGNLTGAAEYLMVRKDGSHFFCEANANILCDANNNPIGILYVARDISERKLAEKALEQISTRLSLATLAGGVGVWDYDLVNNTLVWDNQMFKLYGIDKNDFVGAYQTWKAGLHPDDVQQGDAEIQMAIRGEKEFDTEFRVVWPDGSVHNIRAMAIVQNDDSGKPLRMIGTNWDITEQKKTEAVLVKAKLEAETANKSKSVFLANMSHEIRTPLNAIIGFSQLLNHDKHLTDTQKEYNLSIIRAGEHLLALINDILELSKVEAGRVVLNPSNIDLHALIEDIHLIFKERAQSKHLQFIFETADNLPRFVLVDESKLRQIFINLIGNAVKFTDEGGVAVRVSFAKADDDTNRLIVEIQDTGTGIPENEINDLFKHFVQTSSGIKKGSGTGLGLALSRELAIIMGGNITVSSEIGIGSLFTFYVEMKEGKMEAMESKTTKRVIGMDKNQKNYRILVVDDKQENLKVAVNLLKLVGFETNEAVDGLDAITKFEQWNPHLILMDMRMPVMDGYEATRRIKSTEKGKQTPIVALTASTFEEEKKKTKTLGMQGYIHKPFRESELFGTIGKILGIKYIYEDTTLLPPAKYHNDDKAIAKDISKLPNSLILLMQNAVAVADLDLLIELINSIESDNPELAHQLMTLARNYDYNYLNKILNNKKP